MVNKKQIKHLGRRCIGPTITPQKIKELKKERDKDENLKKAKKYFAILAGKTRLDILYLLKKEKELCVCDMADILKTSISVVSHQLKVLRASGFVETRRDAQTIFYSLSREIAKKLKNRF